AAAHRLPRPAAAPRVPVAARLSPSHGDGGSGKPLWQICHKGLAGRGRPAERVPANLPEGDERSAKDRSAESRTKAAQAMGVKPRVGQSGGRGKQKTPEANLPQGNGSPGGRGRQAGSADEACRELVERALDKGGKDNVTVVLARYRFGE